MVLTRLTMTPAARFSGLLMGLLVLLIGCGGNGDNPDLPPVDIDPIKVSGVPTEKGLDQRFDVFEWASDSSLIAYLARQATPSSELYTSTPNGSTNSAVSPVPLAVSEVDSFAWAPDSSRLAYLADQQTPNVLELYSSEPDGTDNQNISRSITFGTLEVRDYAWASSSPSEDVVVFIAKELTGSTFELYSSNYDGVTVEITKLSEITLASTNVEDFAVSPDGTTVVYKADQQTAGTFELYAVPVDGTIQAFNISRAPGIIPEVVSDQPDFAWSSDSLAIAFRALDLSTNPPGGNIRLFTAPITTGNSVAISAAPPIDGEVSDFAWSPISAALAYTLNNIQGSPNKINLWSTIAFGSGGDNNLLSNNPTGGSILTAVTDFQWSPNGLLIAFISDVSTTGLNELLVADPSQVGAPPISLSGTLQGQGAVTGFEWQPNSLRVAYRADQFLDQRFDLFTVFADGSRLPVQISQLTFDNSSVGIFGWAPNSSLIAYISDQDTVGIDELYTDNASGTSPRKVSADLFSGENVFNFAWSPDSTLVAYQANQDDINKFELYTTLP